MGSVRGDTAERQQRPGATVLDNFVNLRGPRHCEGFGDIAERFGDIAEHNMGVCGRVCLERDREKDKIWRWLKI